MKQAAGVGIQERETSGPCCPEKVSEEIILETGKENCLEINAETEPGGMKLISIIRVEQGEQNESSFVLLRGIKMCIFIKQKTTIKRLRKSDETIFPEYGFYSFY